jgi:NAD(P)-dependent dehydrogenase (short-subunit alcohol dehydrogenase family)
LKEALRQMTDGGRIVCVSTIGTVLNLPSGACYFRSKAAVEQFCRTLAKEVAPRGITVNVASPGFTETAMLLANIDAEARPRPRGNYAALPSWTPKKLPRSSRFWSAIRAAGSTARISPPTARIGSR